MATPNISQFVPEQSPAEQSIEQALVNAINQGMSTSPWDIYPTDPGLTAEQLAQIRATVEVGGELPSDLAALIDPSILRQYEDFSQFLDLPEAATPAMARKLVSLTYPGGQASPFTDEYFTQQSQAIQDYNNPWVQAQLGNLQLNQQLLEGAVAQLPIEQENMQLYNQIIQRAVADLDSPATQNRIAAEEAYWNEVAQEAQKGIDLGSITGDLTAAEEQLLSQKRENAYTMVNNSITRNVQDSIGTEIARLVNNGVLNSTTAAQAFEKIGQQVAQISSDAGLGIENEYITSELAMRGQNYANRLQSELGRMGFISQGGVVSGQTDQGDYSNLLSSLGSQNYNRNYLDYLNSSNQYYAGRNTMFRESRSVKL